MMKLYMVRHGRTAWNALGKVQGSADVPLGEEGIRLAAATGKALLDVPFDLCFTSPLIRARRTAELILSGRDVPIIPDSRLSEIDFGVLEGSRFRDETGRVQSPEMETFFEHPESFQRPEGGESIQDVIWRTGDFLTEKITDPDLFGKTILISTHGCALRALLQNIKPSPGDFWRGKVPPNCSISIAEAEGKKLRLLALDLVPAG